MGFPKQLFLLIVVLMNVIIIKEGYLLNEKLYLALIGTIPLLFYAIFRMHRRIM